MRVADAVEALRKRRSDMGISQDDAAELIGWKRQQLSAYESGAKEPGLEALSRWGDALGCPVLLIVGEKAELAPSLPRAIASLARGWEAGTHEDRQAIERVLRRWEGE